MTLAKEQLALGGFALTLTMDELLGRIKTRLANIDALLAEYAEHWAEEDGVYRF